MSCFQKAARRIESTRLHQPHTNQQVADLSLSKRLFTEELTNIFKIETPTSTSWTKQEKANRKAKK